MIWLIKFLVEIVCIYLVLVISTFVFGRNWIYNFFKNDVENEISSLKNQYNIKGEVLRESCVLGTVLLLPLMIVSISLKE